jgi:hypothetical protein
VRGELMAIQQIQQLEHDGKRLYCPLHPERKLAIGDEIQSANGARAYTIVCTGGNPVVGGACMNSAQWQTQADRDQYFAQTSELSGWQRIRRRLWR